MKSQISTPRFTQLLSATPRGARLARLLAVRELATWGWPETCADSETAALIVGELAANAVTHGRVKGRCFRLTLAMQTPGTLRIAVADPRGEYSPHPRPTTPADETGRGLLLVAALATRWGTEPWPPSGKAVWADIALG